MVEVIAFPASYGESILVRFADIKKNILIDGGFKDTYYKYIKPKLQEISKEGEKIDLLIITHIDLDHIEGIKYLLQENGLNNKSNIIKIEEVWFNSYANAQFIKKLEKETSEKSLREIKRICKSLSYPQFTKREIAINDGKSVAQLLIEGKYKINSLPICVENIKIHNIDEIKVHVISPTLKEIEGLEMDWEKQLNSKGIDFITEHDKIMTDVVEYISLKHEEAEIKTYSREISSTSFLSENIKKILDKELVKMTSPVNASSIAIMIEYKKIKMLFLGDADSNVIEDWANKFCKENEGDIFDLVKISHHGSNSNTSKDLIKLLKTNNYLICTNGIQYKHPDKELIIKLLFLNREKKFLFFPMENMNINNKQMFDELMKNEVLKTEYNYEIVYLNRKSIKL